MRTQRIIFICLSKPSEHQSAIGGMEQQVLRLSRQLSEDPNLHVGLVAGDHLLAKSAAAVETFTANPSQSRRSRSLHQQLQASIKVFSPDIVHCHGLKSAQTLMRAYGHAKSSSLSPSPSLKNGTGLADFSTVLSVHGDKKELAWTAWFDHLIAVSPNIETQLKRHNIPCTYIPNAVPNESINTTVNAALNTTPDVAINAASPDTPELFTKEGAVQSAREDTAEGATDYTETLTKEALYKTFKLTPSAPLVIAVGRLAKVKQYDTLMKAIIGLPANLLIVGDGPEQKSLSKLQASNIKLAGYRQDAQALIACADALVINSSREGLSLSMLEALHAGTTVLSTPVSGTHLLPSDALLHATNLGALRAEIADKLSYIQDINKKQQAIYDQQKHQLSPEAMLRSTKRVYQNLADTQTKLLFLGDCNTCGTDALKSSSTPATYPQLFASATNKLYKNCGQTMSTTREALQYFAEHRRRALETVFIQYGLVDSWQTIKAAPYVLYYPDTPTRRFLRRWVKKWKKYGRKIGLGHLFGMQNQVPIEEYKQNIEDIITACAQQQTQVVLIETAPNHDHSRNPAIKAYNAALKALAGQHANCKLIQVYNEFEQHMDTYYIDPTHFSAAGHARLAERVIQGLNT